MYNKIKIQKICEIYYEGDYCDILYGISKIDCPQRYNYICILKDGEILEKDFKLLRYERTDYCKKRNKNNLCELDEN